MRYTFIHPPRYIIESGGIYSPKDVYRITRSETVHQDGFNLRNGNVSDDPEVNDTESDGSESNDIGSNPGSDETGPEQNGAQESRETESDEEPEELAEEDEEAEEEEEDVGAKFFYNLYYKVLTGAFHHLGVIIKFIHKTYSIIKNFFEDLWVKIKRLAKKLEKKILEKLKAIWEKIKGIWEEISQEVYPAIINFIGEWSLEIFVVLSIIFGWYTCFHHHVLIKYRKKKKEKKKGMILENALAGLVDLENGSSCLSDEELAEECSKLTGDEIVGAEEGGSIIETIPEGEEESTECSTSISTEDDTLVTSNASVQV